MDLQFIATREDLHNVAMEVKQVQAIQSNHADRLMRLEKRQADDAALKSVWGTGSPFPSILSGTPQQGPIQNPTADVFDDFDDEQGQNLLSSLHIDADEEPVRRGASRANSVRFDVSALQGSNWAASSRNSGDFGPVRPSSGFGSHPMTERSLSHKSDGRHSSAGHSVHSMQSGRTSSLGLDTNFIIGDHGDDSSLDIPDPPPGLFILGSVPSIIRCWLTTHFSHNALLYAVVCTGSQRSILDYSLIKDLGLADQVQKHSNGKYMIRLPVYLPEAVITQSTSRSNSPAPQLPALSANFEVIGMTQRSSSTKKLRVFIGSDTLRAHNADILFSQNLMTLYGDERNKLSVPFVRPEDENLFRNLCTTYVPPEKNELKATAPAFMPTEIKPKVETAPGTPNSISATANEPVNKVKISDEIPQSIPPAEPQSLLDASTASDPSTRPRASSVKSGSTSTNGNLSDNDKQSSATRTSTEQDRSENATSDSARRESSNGIWGSWRQGSTSMTGSENESTSGYQRASRGGRSMKVLKPSSKAAAPSTTSAPPRSVLGARTGAAYEPAPIRPSGEVRRKSQVTGVENLPLRWEGKRVVSEEQKPGAPKASIPVLPRSSNPIGGASAFAWMTDGKPKANVTTSE